MTDKEALKLALEALGLYQAAGFGNSTDFNKQHEAFYKAQIAITAIQQAMLAAPVQEPVATVQCINGITIGYLDVMQPVGTKLYTTSPQNHV